MNWFCFSITSARVAELILVVLGHSKVESLAFFFFFTNGCGAEDWSRSVPSLHVLYSWTVVSAEKLRCWGLLKLVLSPVYWNCSFCEVSKWLVSWGMTPIAPSSKCTVAHWASACHSFPEKRTARSGRSCSKPAVSYALCSQPSISQ